MKKFLTVCTLSVAALTVSACAEPRPAYRADPVPVYAPAYTDENYVEPVRHVRKTKKVHKKRHCPGTTVITKTVDANGKVIKTTTSKQ